MEEQGAKEKSIVLGEIKRVRHTLDGGTGEHRQWLVKNYGTDEEEEIEIFKGDPDWEE